MKHDVCIAYFERRHRQVTVEASTEAEAVAKAKAMVDDMLGDGEDWQVDEGYLDTEVTYVEPAD